MRDAFNTMTNQQYYQQREDFIDLIELELRGIIRDPEDLQKAIEMLERKKRKRPAPT